MVLFNGGSIEQSTDAIEALLRTTSVHDMKLARTFRRDDGNVDVDTHPRYYSLVADISFPPVSETFSSTELDLYLDSRCSGCSSEGNIGLRSDALANLARNVVGNQLCRILRCYTT